jgi:DNA polymerase-1
MGDGPVPARVMVVGEAPGFREDEIKKPFAGKAGQYLDTLLEEVGLPRESIYITNANKCRPPDNRTPTRTEIKACHPFLEAELQAVQPEFLVTLGNVALQSVTGKSGIMKKRGAMIDMGHFKVLPTLHPAAILRNPAWAPLLKSDLQAVTRAVKGQNEAPKTKTQLIRNSRALAKFLRLVEPISTPIAFDLETWGPSEKGGLRPWAPGGKILTCSFTWKAGESYVVAIEHPSVEWDIPVERVYDAIQVAFESKKMVGHNVKFDLSWMRAKGVKLTASFDTLLAAHLLDENRPNGLKPLSRTYLGADLYEAKIDFDEPHKLSELAVYNGKDTDYTFRLYHLFREELRQRPRLLRLFKFLMMPACNAFVEIESHGFPIDMERLETRHREALAKIDEITTELLQYVPKELRAGANFRSVPFLARFFFEHLKLPILVISPKTKKPSTSEAVLLKLKHMHPSVQLLMTLRKWQKYESTYTRAWSERVRVARRPRLYTSYNLSGTVTGRLSSDMQQVPRDLFIRSIIGSQPGWKLIEADFSQVELRLAAMFSRDPALTRAFRTGGDPHRETAAKVLNKPPQEITKEERKMAKAVNFGFLYGMGARKFRVYADEKYDTKVSEEEAIAYRKAFFKQYAGLPIWHQRMRRLVRTQHWVASPIGRIRHLPAILSTDEGVQAEAEREAINSPVQGLASDLTVLSMVLLSGRLDHTKSRIIGNVHDSVLLEATDDYADTAARIVKETMEQLPLSRYFGFKPTVPIEADVTIGSHWGEA